MYNASLTFSSPCLSFSCPLPVPSSSPAYCLIIPKPDNRNSIRADRGGVKTPDPRRCRWQNVNHCIIASVCLAAVFTSIVLKGSWGVGAILAASQVGWSSVCRGEGCWGRGVNMGERWRHSGLGFFSLEDSICGYHITYFLCMLSLLTPYSQTVLE